MRHALLAAVVLVMACGESVAPVRVTGTPGAQASVRDRLSLEYVLFRVLPVDSKGSVIARRVLAAEESEIALNVSDGRFFAQAGLDPAGNVLQLKNAQVVIDSISATPAQLPPNGLTLVDAIFTLDGPKTLPLRWYGDGSVGWAEGVATFRFTSKVLMSNGDTSPLDVGSLTAPVEALVVDRDGSLAFTFEIEKVGQVWDWAGLFQLRDLGLHTEALELTPQDEPPVETVLQ